MEALIKAGDVAGIVRLISMDPDSLERPIGELELPPLSVAVENNQPNVLIKLIQLGADIDKQNKYEQSPLMIAVNCSNRKMAEILLANRADVDLSDGSWMTPLWKAVKYDNEPMARLLAMNGARSDLKDCRKRCERYGRHSLASFLRKMEHRNEQTLMEALFDEELEYARSIAWQINIRRLPDGEPEFMYAVENDYLDLADYMSRSADLNEKDVYGRTPLSKAFRAGSKKLMLYLLMSEADVNVQSNGETVLMEACGAGDLESAMLLLRWRADMECLRTDGLDALEIARRANKTNIVNVLEFLMHNEVAKVLRLELQQDVDFVLLFSKEFSTLEDCRKKLTLKKVEDFADHVECWNDSKSPEEILERLVKPPSVPLESPSTRNGSHSSVESTQGCSSSVESTQCCSSTGHSLPTLSVHESNGGVPISVAKEEVKLA